MSQSRANFQQALVLLPASTRIIKCECSVAIALPMLVVVRAPASPATTLVVAGTYVKIIASFNFHVIPGIISCDEHVDTFGASILGNIVVLRDNGEWRCKYVNLFT